MVYNTLANNTHSQTPSLASDMVFVEFELTITYTLHIVLAITLVI
jgi:hypothetical protein